VEGENQSSSICPLGDKCEFKDVGYCQRYGYSNCLYNVDGTPKDLSYRSIRDINPIHMRRCFSPRCTYCKWQESCPEWNDGLVPNHYGEVCGEFKRILPYSEDEPEEGEGE
jgi:hypothetical protein